MFGIEDDIQPPTFRDVAGRLYLDRLSFIAGRCPF